MRLTLSTVVRAVIIVIVVSLCGIHPSTAGADEIKIAGSTTFAPLVSALAEAFMAKNPNVKITFVEGSASACISSLLEGEIAIGCSARYLKGEESEKATSKGINLDCRSIAIDSVVPIIHPSNSVNTLGLIQVNAIYKGDLKNWKDFDGGKDSTIKVITREAGSAMDEFWKEKVMRQTPVSPQAVTSRTNMEIVNAVASDPSAIGYTSISLLNPQVKQLRLNGIETTAVPTEHHPLARKLLMCTTGKASAAVQQFVDFIGGSEGKSIVQRAGFVPQ